MFCCQLWLGIYSPGACPDLAQAAAPLTLTGFWESPGALASQRQSRMPFMTIQQELYEGRPSKGIHLYNLNDWKLSSSVIFLSWDLGKEFHKPNKKGCIVLLLGKKLILELFLKMGSEGLGKSLWELRKFLEVVSKCKLESKSRGLNLLRTRQRGQH